MTPPPSVRAYAPTFPLFEATPPGAAPDPRLKPGPVFVASGGLIFFFCQVFFRTRTNTIPYGTEASAAG